MKRIILILITVLLILPFSVLGKEEITVVYHSNDGTNRTKTKTIEKAGSYRLEGQDLFGFSKGKTALQDKVIDSWNTNPDDTGYYYPIDIDFDSSLYSYSYLNDSSNITLYAIWDDRKDFSPSLLDITLTGDGAITDDVFTKEILGTKYTKSNLKIDGYELVEISNNGTYNKQNNTITWKIDHLEGNDHVELHYRAITPSKTSGKDLMSHSTIKSDQVTTAVQSNTTIVTLDRIIEIIDNPNTGSNNIYIPNTNIGMSLSLLFVITLVVGITTFLLVKTFKRKINNNILKIS